MRTLRRNMARNRNYLEDFSRLNGQDMERFFQKSNSRSMQQSQRFQSGSLSMQPTMSTEDRVDRLNKYQDNLFENVGTQTNIQPIQYQQPANMPSGSNNGMVDFGRGNGIFGEKYFENMNSQPGQQQFASQKSDFGKSPNRGIHFDNQYGGGPLPQQNFRYQEPNYPSRTNRQSGNFDTRRNNDGKFERNQDFRGSFQPSRSFIGRNGMNNDDNNNFGRNGDFVQPRAQSFGNMGGRNNDFRNNDKYFDMKFDGLTQSPDHVGTASANNFNRKDFFGEKYIDRELNRRNQQQNMNTAKPEIFSNVGHLRNDNSNEKKYFESVENQMTTKQMYLANNQDNGNGIEHKSVTRQHVSFADNGESVQREQVTKYQNDKNNFLEKKDEFRTIIQRLTEMQNNFDSRREKMISQHASLTSVSPRVTGLFKS